MSRGLGEIKCKRKDPSVGRKRPAGRAGPAADFLGDIGQVPAPLQASAFPNAKDRPGHSALTPSLIPGPKHPRILAVR